MFAVARHGPFAAMVALLACASGSSRPAGGAIGDPCAAAADCQSGLFCETQDPGGQCLRDCNEDADCGPANLCALDDGRLKCYRACRTTTDCPRPGYPCVGADERDATRTFCDTATSDGATDAHAGGG